MTPARPSSLTPIQGAISERRIVTSPGQGASLERATFQRGLNRIDPYMQEQRSAMAQRLQNQGLPVGSEAYNQELNRFDRSRGDQLENLALSSVGAGRQEQGRLIRAGLSFGAVQRQRSATAVWREIGGHFVQRRKSKGAAFGSDLASNQNQFNQNLASNQFNAGESQRNFGERFAGENQYFGQQQARDQFGAAQAARRDQQGIQQQQFGDQFGAQQGRAADQQAIQQNQFGDQFGAGQSRFADQFGAQQQQQGFANRMANQNLLGTNDRFPSPATSPTSSTRICNGADSPRRK